MTSADRLVLDQIRGDLIVQAWPHLEPWFRKAAGKVPTTEETAEDILYKAQNRRCDLWAIYNKDCPLPVLGAAATAINGSTIRIISFGGRDFFRWGRQALAEFETLARRNGMTQIEIRGRKGWLKVFPEYDLRHVTLGKML